MAAILGAAAALAIGVALLVPALLFPARGSTQAPALSQFVGSYVHAGDPRELHGMERAIDHVVDQLNLFIREIARGEIHRRIRPEQHIRFDVSPDDTITIALDDWGPIEVPVNGPARPVRDAAGDAVRLSMRYDAGTLVARSVAQRGSRTNVFSLRPDGERLSMLVRIHSDQLPSDIRYRLTYRRAD